MTTEDTTQLQGGSEALPAADVKPPRNDAEAAAQDAAKPAASAEPPADEEAKKAEAAKQADEAKRNRTRSYIERLQGETAAMRRELQELRAAQERQQQRPQPQAQHGREPTLEDFNFDLAAFQTYREQKLAERLRADWTTEQKQAAQQREEQDRLDAYDRRIAAFEESHPDFREVVGAIDPQFLSPQLEAAVMAHEKGPELAYLIATDEEALFAVASVRPELQAAAVARLASRLGSAPAAAAANEPPQLQPKPITQAPPPPPRVTSRSATETPAEKLTDDEWWKREKERRRKR